MWPHLFCAHHTLVHNALNSGGGEGWPPIYRAVSCLNMGINPGWFALSGWDTVNALVQPQPPVILSEIVLGELAGTRHHAQHRLSMDLWLSQSRFFASADDSSAKSIGRQLAPPVKSTAFNRSFGTG